MKTEKFAKLLLQWYQNNGRSYAWRGKNDPYAILIAEIMLQRTRASQVEPVYLSFIEEFPTLKELNDASYKRIEKHFAKLGLIWRAGLVRSLAHELVTEFNGKVPDSAKQLLSLPGVGEYVADAVLSSAYGRHVAAVDANVCRILGRIFNLKARGEARRDSKFKELAQKILPRGRAKEFNWAMIDFGALVCAPRKPACGTCPLSSICDYGKGRQGNSPALGITQVG